MNSYPFAELFQCLEDVVGDYWTTYDPVEGRESKVATVSTDKIVALHDAYRRIKEEANAAPEGD